MATKLTIANISADYGSVTSINNAFDAVETAIDNTLSRDGTAPNFMQAELDMNSNNVNNVSTLRTNRLFVNGQQYDGATDATDALVDLELTTDIGLHTGTPSSYRTAYYDSNEIVGSGAKWVWTGAANKNVGLAGTGLHTDGYVYNGNGDQYELATIYINGNAHGIYASATDNTVAMQKLLTGLSTNAVIALRPGTYVFGASNTEVSLVSNVTFVGKRGQVFFKAHADLVTSNASEAAYKAMFKGDSVSNVHFRGIGWRQSSDSASQAKVKFKNSSNITITDFDSEENNVWDFLFNTCTDFRVENFHIDCGISGTDYGVGVRVCGKSKRGKIDNFTIKGKLVTQNQAGAGVQPSGDKWGSVGINIDCSNEDHINSNQFKAGHIEITTDGVATTAAYTISGLDATNWKAWINQRFDYSTPSSTNTRDNADVTLGTNSLDVSGLTAAAGIVYDVYYAYYEHTPEDIIIDNGHLEGFTFGGISIINGINVHVGKGVTFKHIGDLGFDPEGCLNTGCAANSYIDCAQGAGVAGFNNYIEGGIFDGCSNSDIALYGDGGAGYQAYNQNGKDYGTEQYKVDITAGAPSGANQVLSAVSGDPFRFVEVGDRISIIDGAATYSYEVTVKTSDINITVDNTKAWTMPTVRVDGTHVIPTGTITIANWWKTGFRQAPYGMIGNEKASNHNSINGPSTSVIGSYASHFSIDNPSVDKTIRGLEFNDCDNFSVNGGDVSGWVYAEDCYNFRLVNMSIIEAKQRAFLLRSCKHFFVEDNKIINADRQGIGNVYSIVYGECSDGVIRNNTSLKTHGGVGDFLPYPQQGKFDKAGNTVTTTTPGNSDMIVEDNCAINAVTNTIEKNPVITFADADATPSVLGGSLFKTANTGATTITGLDDLPIGKPVKIIIGDVNTTIDFTGTSLKGNGGVDWSPTTNDHMTCVSDGANIYCDISDNTA